MTGSHLVVEEETRTYFIPLSAIPAQAQADATIALAHKANEVMAQGWETSPDLAELVDRPIPVPIRDVDLAIAPDYAGQPYEPGLETDGPTSTRRSRLLPPRIPWPPRTS